MKRALWPVALLLLTTLSQSAFADGRHHRRDWGWNDHYRSNHYRSYSRYSPRYNDYWGVSYSSRRHYSHHDGSAFVGGLLLGSALSWPSQPRYETRYYTTVVAPPVQEVTVIRSSSSSTVSQLPKRRLLKDLQGRCFERIQEDGQEVLVELDASACDF